MGFPGLNRLASLQIVFRSLYINIIKHIEWDKNITGTLWGRMNESEVSRAQGLATLEISSQVTSICPLQMENNILLYLFYQNEAH